MSVRSAYLKRGEYAYKNITEVKKNNEEIDEKKLKSYIRSVPSYIKTNGLLATITFIKAKSQKSDESKTYSKNKQNEYGEIFNIIDGWVNESNDSIDLINFITNLDQSNYRIIEREVLQLFVWLKRFAESELEGEE